MSSENYHEPLDALSGPTRELHRALSSLMEELEAVDWYQQRVDASGDADLAAILAHNRDEEVEHAMMVLEWIRRRFPKFDEHIRTYLLTEGPITEIESEATESEVTEEGGARGGGAPRAADRTGSLGIGSLRGGASG